MVWNLLPEGQASGFRFGKDIHGGIDLEERKAIFGQLGDVYITFEGGPGVAQEADAAWSRGATIVPLARTGGASCGMFGFPPAALERPAAVNAQTWELLSDKVTPVAMSAKAATNAVIKIASQRLGLLGPAELAQASAALAEQDAQASVHSGHGDDHIASTRRQLSVSRMETLAYHELSGAKVDPSHAQEIISMNGGFFADMPQSQQREDQSHGSSAGSDATNLLMERRVLATRVALLRRASDAACRAESEDCARLEIDLQQLREATERVQALAANRSVAEDFCTTSYVLSTS